MNASEGDRVRVPAQGALQPHPARPRAQGRVHRRSAPVHARDAALYGHSAAFYGDFAAIYGDSAASSGDVAAMHVIEASDKRCYSGNGSSTMSSSFWENEYNPR
eukprot:749275-Rhodomonas_salina.5